MFGTILSLSSLLIFYIIFKVIVSVNCIYSQKFVLYTMHYNIYANHLHDTR